MAILAYHMVNPRFVWGITRVTPGQFRAQIRDALNRGFTFYTLSDYCDLEPEPEKALALTFDDGFENVFDFALPVCRQYGVAATIFCMPLYIGQFNSWDVNWGWQRFRHLDWHQLCTLRDAGWEIGSHGFSHVDLRLLTEERAEEELVQSRQRLVQRLQTPVNFISYPFGNADARVCRLARHAGYRGGVVMSRQVKGENAFSRPRTGIYWLDSRRSFRHKISGSYKVWYQGLQKGLDICSDGTVFVKQCLNQTS